MTDPSARRASSDATSKSPAAVPSAAQPGTRVRGVALDMDGLMFDTEPLYQLAADRLLRQRGRRYEDAVRRQMMGQPGPQAIQLMLSYYGLDEPWEAVLAEAEGNFAELVKQELRTLPGLPALLETFDALRVPYGVATSSRRSFAEDLLQRGGIHAALRFVLTGDDVTHGKPHPEIYLAAAVALGISASSMLVFEDSGNGCAAAVAAGAITIAVPGPHSVDHDFSGATLVADSLQDPRVIALVDQFCRES